MSGHFRVVIPARYDSSRLPGKPLLTFENKTIIEHVYLNACASEAKSVLIATDDERIANTAAEFGAEVCMTSLKHMSGTDRLAEAVHAQGWEEEEIIVNVQGDEPQMPAENINQVAELLNHSTWASMGTLCHGLSSIEEYKDPNIVKVVMTDTKHAMYFSRSPLPYLNEVNPKILQNSKVYKHVGIYSYRVKYLREFVSKKQSTLEKIERLEQLRALETGDEIIIDECIKVPGIGIDTMHDYHRLKTTSP
ncbi:MAG: 3-deoxy-manno-octulosonate cytidylyltransferase [Pseudomonadota bacterium]